jgi:glutamyl-tRNA reductase
VKLVLVGLSHRTAPVEVRERFAGAPGETPSDFAESATISTCNRIELLAVSDQPERAALCLREWFGDGVEGLLYELHGTDAVRHVFRVASSLDSMVVGEAQILGQLKDTYRGALAVGGCGPVLHQLFQRAFRTAKRVRSETGLGSGQVSVARVGVQLAAEVFESLDDKRVLLVGAGEMAESALAGLHGAGARDLLVLNRTAGTAELLADRLGARSGGLDRLDEALRECDVVVTSVSLDRPLLDAESLREAGASRHGRPLLMIDLGIPRNVDPDVNVLDDVYLYDLDDLDEVAQRGQAQRSAAIVPAEAIVEAECERFERWHSGVGAVPVIKALRERAEALLEAELREASALDPEARRLAESLLARLLHEPLTRLRAEAEEGNAPYYADAIAEIFGLREDDD